MIRRHAIALALPLVYAAAVLGATAVNRRDGRGPTVLTEREIVLGVRDDNRSVPELWLSWSEPAGPPGSWLPPATLAALGFDVSVDPAAGHAAHHYRRQLARRAYVAFEIDGPAWQAVLAERERAEGAGEAVPQDDLRRNGSRVVPVDSAVDAQTLTQRYPDPRTHLIARALIRVQRYERRPGAAPYVGGWLINVDPRRIQVPVELSRDLPVRQFNENQRDRFTVSLMYGRRWEPWVTAVSREGASR